MDKLNKEYIEILSGDGNPSDKFWKLEERIKTDKKACDVQREMSRSNQFYIMMSLLNEGAITMDDLNDFSDEFYMWRQAYGRGSHYVCGKAWRCGFDYRKCSM